MSDNFSMRSMRLPLGRSFHVGGKRETRLNHTVPGEWMDTTKRALVVGITSRGVRSLTVYFCQVLVRFSTLAVRKTAAPSLLSKVTVRGPLKPAAALA